MTMLLFRHLFGFTFSLLISVYVMPLLIQIARKFGITDNPNKRLKTHKIPTPYLGGIGVFCGFVVTLGLVYPLENHVMWLVLGCTELLFLGLLDDLIDLSPRQKILGHIFAVLCFLNGGIWLRHMFFASYFTLPFSFVWMLAIINAFNLVDVMDGLSSTVALSAAIGFGSIALFAHFYEISLLLFIFAGAVSGFFMFNKPPASIYLGDCGSLFLGGFFAAVPLLFSWSSLHKYGFITPSLLLGVPLAEVLILTLIRTYKRIPFYYGSPHHFALYLHRKGWSIWRILFFTALISLLLCLVGMLFIQHGISLAVTLGISSLLFLFCIFIIYL